jgi:GDPmannose 4,6-dehydratase
LKRALITGITGQDGSYLAELLLSKGYEVYGVIRRSSSFNTERLDPVYQDPHSANYKLRLVYGDLDDASSVNSIIRTAQPTRSTTWAPRATSGSASTSPSTPPRPWPWGPCACSRGCASWGRLPLLPGLVQRDVRAAPPPQNELTPLQPRSPYACAKVFAHQLCQNYREAYGLFICCGILFNHESPRRGVPFVTRKITRRRRPHQARPGQEALPRQPGGPPRLGLRGRLRRGDVADAAAGAPDDYVIATGESHSVHEVLESPFRPWA